MAPNICYNSTVSTAREVAKRGHWLEDGCPGGVRRFHVRRRDPAGGVLSSGLVQRNVIIPQPAVVQARAARFEGHRKGRPFRCPCFLEPQDGPGANASRTTAST